MRRVINIILNGAQSTLFTDYDINFFHYYEIIIFICCCIIEFSDM